MHVFWIYFLHFSDVIKIMGTALGLLLFYTISPSMNFVFLVLVLIKRIFRLLHIPVPGMLLLIKDLEKSLNL